MKQFSRLFLISLIIGVMAYSGTRLVNADDGTLTADSGFRPKANGFSFENYSNEAGVKNLSAVEMRAMFGDQVCGSLANDTCTLTPPAEKWMEDINAAMNGGHCDGMAALSLLFYYQQFKLEDYGGDQTTASLKFKDNEKLQHAIAYYWATQVTSPTADNLVMDKTPNEIVDLLSKSFVDKSESYAVSIRKRDNTGGHAITPYAIMDKGGGKLWIMVYDNNFPGEERYIEIDSTANTWQYIASTNPKEPAGLYDGDAESKTLRLKPMSPRLDQQTCDFCAASTAKVHNLAKTSAKYNKIYLTTTSAENNAEILIMDADGHKLGYSGGKFLNEIPGAHVLSVDSDDLYKDDPASIFEIPIGITFAITLDATNVKAEQVTSIDLIGPGYDLAVEAIKLDPGQVDAIAFSADGTKIVYKSNRGESPDFSIGLERTGADYEFNFKGVDIDPDGVVTVTLDFNNGKISLGTADTKASAQYALEVSRIDDKGEEVFGHDGIDLAADESAVVAFGQWKGNGNPLSVEIHKAAGSVDHTVDLTDDH